MVEFTILPVHAAMALGVRVDQLNLPRSEYGIDADALWTCPRFVEIRRSRAAIAHQMAERRVNAELHRPVRTPEELKIIKRRARKAARNARRKAMRADAASI